MSSSHAWVALAGLMGAAAGSYLSAVAYRLPLGVSRSEPSRCPHCTRRLRAWENVPVVGWLALRARCGGCRARIPARYVLLEVGMGASWALVAAGMPGAALAALVEVVVWLLGLVSALRVMGALSRRTFSVADAVMSCLPVYALALVPVVTRGAVAGDGTAMATSMALLVGSLGVAIADDRRRAARRGASVERLAEVAGGESSARPADHSVTTV